MLKTLLSDLGAAFHKTHELGALMDALERSGPKLPGGFEDLDKLTPFGTLYRYDDYDGAEPLNRYETRATLRSLRAFVEEQMRNRSVSEAT
jgi:HEPN domain-containing protein